jgi:hypothetical protein
METKMANHDHDAAENGPNLGAEPAGLVDPAMDKAWGTSEQAPTYYLTLTDEDRAILHARWEYSPLFEAMYRFAAADAEKTRKAGVA